MPLRSRGSSGQTSEHRLQHINLIATLLCVQSGVKDDADEVQEDEAERLSDHRLQRIGRELWEEEPSEPQVTATPARSPSSPPAVTSTSSPVGVTSSSPQQQGSPGSPEPASSTSGSALRPPPKLTAAAALALEIACAPWNMSASPRGGGAVQAVQASGGSVLGRGAAAGRMGEGDSALLGRGGTAAGLRGDSGALSEDSSRGGEGARDEWVNIPGPMRVTGETQPAAPMDPGGAAADAGSGEGTARRMTGGGGNNNGATSAVFDEKAATEALSEQ